MKVRELLQGERGFGMVEALISMLLLAIVAVAFLPMLVAGLKAATINTTVTTATQAVNEQLAPISTRTHTCDEINTWLATTPTVEDKRGVEIHLHRMSGTTPASYDTPVCATGGTVRLTVTATTDSAAPVPSTAGLASASTIVRIE